VLVPDRREVFFQISHHHIDGVGAMMFLNFLIDALAQPKDVEFGDEYRHLSNSLTHLLNLGSPSKADTERARKMVGELASSFPTLRLRQAKNPNPTYAVHMERLEFSLACTRDIHRQAVYRVITVTQACHSSMVMALNNLATVNAVVDAAAHASLLFTNLRQGLPSDPKHEHSPVSVHLTAQSYYGPAVGKTSSISPIICKIAILDPT
jgi:hypothetical protein